MCIRRHSDRQLHNAIVQKLHDHVSTYAKALDVVQSDALMAVRLVRVGDLTPGGLEGDVTEEFHFSFVLAPACKYGHNPAIEMYCILNVLDGEPSMENSLAGLKLQLARQSVVRIQVDFGMPLNRERCTKSGALQILSTDQYAAYMVHGHSREVPNIKCSVGVGRLRSIDFTLLEFVDIDLSTVRTTGAVTDASREWADSINVSSMLNEASGPHVHSESKAPLHAKVYQMFNLPCLCF